jgi:hypothetical protein
MMSKTLALLRERFGVRAERCLLVGFSQPVGLNYRFIANPPGRSPGVIGIYLARIRA